MMTNLHINIGLLNFFGTLFSTGICYTIANYQMISTDGKFSIPV
jgi:hypothetical protein